MGVHHCLDQVPDGTDMNTDACCFDIYKRERKRREGGRDVGEGRREKGGGGRRERRGGGLSCKHTV